MGSPESERLADAVLCKHGYLELALADKRRKYPLSEFNSFIDAARCYVESIGRSNLIDRRVASILYGLSEYLRLERKSVPDQVFSELERIECLLFNGYDPHFEGDEPPGF
jgi:hypothetical protein